MISKDQVFSEALELTLREVQKISTKEAVTEDDREYLLKVLRETKVDKQEIDINWASDMSDEDLMRMLNSEKEEVKDEPEQA